MLNIALFTAITIRPHGHDCLGFDKLPAQPIESNHSRRCQGTLFSALRLRERMRSCLLRRISYVLRVTVRACCRTLAEISGVSRNAIHQIEAGAGFQSGTMKILQGVLEEFHGCVLGANGEVMVKMRWRPLKCGRKFCLCSMRVEKRSPRLLARRGRGQPNDMFSYRSAGS